MLGPGSDPVEAGLVKSLARPGGNVTGISLLTGELSGKRLELLKEAVPKLGRVAVLYDPINQTSVREVKEVLPVAAAALKVTTQLWEVRGADGFEKVFAALDKERSDGLENREADRVGDSPTTCWRGRQSDQVNCSERDHFQVRLFKPENNQV